MINIPVKDIVAKIVEKTGLSEQEIREKISLKLKELSDLVSEEGAAHIIANELGVKLFDTSGKLQIKNILVGMRNVEIIGKIVKKYELREFDVNNRKGKVANLLIGDETGVIRVVLWNDATNVFNELKENDVIRIKGAYVKENNGRKELHLGQDSKIIVNPEGETINVRERKIYSRKNISELNENDENTEILATIVQVYDLKFFEVCPLCNKRAREREEGFFCEQHNIVKPNYNYVLNLFLDDGTGNIRTIFWKQQTQKLLKKSDDEILLFKENLGDFEKIKSELLGNMIKVVGKVNNNTVMNRIEFSADMVFTDINPEEEIERMNKTSETKTESTPEKEIKSTEISEELSFTEEDFEDIDF